MEEVREALKQAKAAYKQLFLVYNQKAADELLKKALSRRIELTLQGAEEMAKQGASVAKVEKTIQTAQTYLESYHWIESGQFNPGMEPEKIPSLDEKRVSAILRTAHENDPERQRQG